MTSSSKQLCRIVIQNEVHCVINGLRTSDTNNFYEDYGMFAANYFFSPKYKLGSWDGKIRFFSKTGKTLVYLLDEIVPQLVKLGYKVEIEDQRKGPYVNIEPISADIFSHLIRDGEPMSLRYYQVEAVNALLADGKGLIEAATSAGKTWITAALAWALGLHNLRTITIVPSTSLVIQTIADFRKAGLDVGEYTGSAKELDHAHIISTWQAIKNHPHLMGTFQCVIVDEVHQAKSKVLNELLNVHGFDIPYRFGLTGTIPKDNADQMTILSALGNIKYQIPAHELIDGDFISSVNVNLIALHENHPEGYFPDFTSEKMYLQSRIERGAWIADAIIEKSELPLGNTFVLVSSVTMGKKLQKMIPNSVFLYGKDAAADRKLVYDLFETNNNMVVIATVHIAGTGLSIDRIFHLFLIDIGKSFTRVIQAIGRSLRKGKDKDHAEVYDICSDLKYSKRHMNMRVVYYKEARYPTKKQLIKYRSYTDNFEQTQDDVLTEIKFNTSLDY